MFPHQLSTFEHIRLVDGIQTGPKTKTAKNYYDKWPPKPKFLYNLLGKKIFSFICCFGKNIFRFEKFS